MAPLDIEIRIDESKHLQGLLKKHQDLVTKSDEINPDNISEVKDFLKELSRGGANIQTAEPRAQLRSLIRYWSGIVNEKTEEYPRVDLQPFSAKADLSPTNIADALANTLKTVVTLGNERQLAKLKAKDSEKEIELKNKQTKFDLKIKEQEAQDKNALSQLEREKQLLALEREQLALEREQLALEREKLEKLKERMQAFLEIADLMVTQLYPDASSDVRATLKQSLLPSIIKLSEGQGLELPALPPKPIS